MITKLMRYARYNIDYTYFVIRLMTIYRNDRKPQMTNKKQKQNPVFAKKLCF